MSKRGHILSIIMVLRYILWLLNKLMNWLINNWCSNSGMSHNILSYNRMIINMLFNSMLGNVFNFSFMSHLWVIFSDMLDLLIISVRLLNRLVMNLLDSLIFSYGFGNWYILGLLLGDVFCVLSFIRNLMVGCNRFIISVGLLNGNMLNVRMRLRLRLSVNNSWSNRLIQRMLNNWCLVNWCVINWLTGNNVLWLMVNRLLVNRLMVNWSGLVDKLRLIRTRHFDYLILENFLLFINYNELSRK